MAGPFGQSAGIRALPKGQALVWLTGAKVALVSTLPWYAGPRADQIAGQVAAAEAGLTGRANAGLTGPAALRAAR